MKSEKYSGAKQVLAGFGLALIILLMTLPAHCATSAPRHDNGLGVVIDGINPLMYNMGVVAHGEILEDAKEREYTSIDFLPYGGPMLYPEGLLLCGNQAKPLTQWPLKVVVLTYERQAHTMFKGIGCHELVSVNRINVQ